MTRRTPSVRRGRRVVPVAVVGALLLTACGGRSTRAADDVARATPSSGPTASPSSTAKGSTTSTTRDTAPVTSELDRLVAAEGLDGAGLVVVDAVDGVVLEHYVGNIDARRVSLIASASKTITAGVLSHLDDEGVLDLDAPVARYAEWGRAHPDITVAQLLSNSSGLKGLDDGPPYAPYLCQYLAAGTLQECARTIFTTPADDADVVPPDTEFRYGGAQWQVAGAVAELASGRSWAQLVEDTFVRPCGLTSLAYNNHFAQMVSPEGVFSYPPQFKGDPATLTATRNPNMEGGAYVTAPDYARLVLMQLRGGRCGATRVLSESAVRRMQTDRIGPAYRGTTGSEPEGYGLGWWVDRDTRYVEDAGAYGAVPWIDLDRRYGAYLVVEHQSRDGAKLAAALRPRIETMLGRP